MEKFYKIESGYEDVFVDWLKKREKKFFLYSFGAEEVYVKIKEMTKKEITEIEKFENATCVTLKNL